MKLEIIFAEQQLLPLTARSEELLQNCKTENLQPTIYLPLIQIITQDALLPITID